MKTFTLVFLSLSFLLFAGCTATAARLGRETAPEVVSSGLQEASEPENRERLREIVSETPVSAALIDIDPRVIDSILARLTASENQKHVQTITRLIAGAMARELAKAPPPEIRERESEVAAQAVKVLVRAAAEEIRTLLPQLIKDTATNPEVRKALKPLSQTAGEGVAKGASDAVLGK